MTTPAKTVIQLVVNQLTDKSSVNWKINELIGYFNAGQREAFNVRPDITATNANMPLVAGAKQTIPADGYLLIEAVRNVGASSRAVTKCERRRMDAIDPNWQGSAAADEALHYMYDALDLDVFFVYPPSTGSGHQMQIVYAKHPVDIPTVAEGGTVALVTGDMSLPDTYVGAMVDYLLYRAYNKNNGVPGNEQKAIAHYATFRQAIAGPVAAAPAPGAA